MANYKVKFTAETWVEAGSEEEAEERVKGVFAATLNITSAKAELRSVLLNEMMRKGD